jgi:tungstate transport system permease protein
VGEICQGIKEAVGLIVRLDPEVIQIIWLSLKVSGTAVLISMILGIPIGTIIALTRFPGRRFLVALTNTGMGLPPVVVGLFVFLFLSRYGPLGRLELLYTPAAMVIAQVVIATPLVVGVTLVAMQAVDPNLRLQILSLGANWWQLFWTLIKETRLTLVAAIAAGFGAIISEIGAVLMVGGNIKGSTRVMTTAIVLETRQGHISMAIALSIILLVIAFVINWVFTSIQQRRSS